MLILSTFNLDYQFTASVVDGEIKQVTISSIFLAIFILLIARLIAWVLTQLVLYNYYKRKEIDIGSQFAINQLLTYVIYVIAILVALDNIGLNLRAVWGGAVALLVGVGLGLQQTFNDFFSGVLILFERSIEVGDILDVDGLGWQGD